MVTEAPLVLHVDGRDVPLPATPPTATLLSALRGRGFVGTKEGCGDGDCGACTVALVSTGPEGTTTYHAVNSCLVPVGSVVGVQVLTVEGVSGAGEALHPVQQAILDCAGSQCGYCTPGFVMSMVAGYHDPHSRTEAGLDPEVVAGNLCRCTGYAPIRRACALLGTGTTPGTAHPTADGTADPGAARVPAVPVAAARATAPGPRRRVEPPALVQGAGRSFHRPGSIGEALALLAEHPGATLLAGGTDLGLELSHHTLDPAVVVSVEDVAELQVLRRTETRLLVGGGVTLTRLEREAAGVLPVMDEMLRWFAARQVRNRATLGGNLGTASPIGDLLPVLLALDAEVVLTGPGGTRTVEVADYFTGYRQTVRRDGELVERVDLPLGPTTGRRSSQAYKVGKRGTDDISVVAAAFVVDRGEDGVVRHARLAYGGVAATPVRALEAEAALVGEVVDRATVDRVAEVLVATFTPMDDHRGSAAYRRRLVGSLFQKFFAEVLTPEVLTPAVLAPGPAA